MQIVCYAQILKNGDDMFFNPIKVIRDKDIRRSATKYYDKLNIEEKDLTVPKHNALVRYKQKTFYFNIDAIDRAEFKETVRRYFRTDFHVKFI